MHYQNGYLVSDEKKVRVERNKLPILRRVFLIKANDVQYNGRVTKLRGIVSVGYRYCVYFPEEMIGKRVRFIVEEANKKENW